MKLIPRLAACAAAMLVTLPVLAQQGDADKGRIKAYTCTGCHGIEGYKNIYPHYHVPKIAGQNFEYLVGALNAYQKGERKHPTMQAQAESFSAEDIADIARYLESAGHSEQ
jgi:cytochrome c553